MRVDRLLYTGSASNWDGDDPILNDVLGTF